MLCYFRVLSMKMSYKNVSTLDMRQGQKTDRKVESTSDFLSQEVDGSHIFFEA